MRRTVAGSICSMLEDSGVEVVFGLPGTQTLDLWEALRTSGLRTVVATSELGAAFMAGGLARATGRPGTLVTIGEPGFAFAVPGVVESLLDSVPLVHVASGARRVAPGPAGELRQGEVARLIYKAVFEPTEPVEVSRALGEALASATSGEPGPVLVQVAPALLGSAVAGGDAAVAAPAAAPHPDHVAQLVDELRRATRPLLFCGSGVAGATDHVIRLAKALTAPVLTTTSGRGVIPESHPLSLSHDAVGADVKPLNELIRGCDLVLVVGARLSDNGTRGGGLVLPESTLVRIDASPDVLGGRYPARLEIVDDAERLVHLAADALERERGASTWSVAEIASWREQLAVESLPTFVEPLLGGQPAREFFRRVREVIPAATPVATDSGLHQYLVRAHLRVIASRTLLCPADFQSMGFGIPTAIGAAAVCGPAVAIVGDGGFNINGTELVTAVRERLPVTVLVLVDRQLGLIRAQQLRRTGRPVGVAISCPDLELFARSIGADYLALADGDPSPLGELVVGGGVTVVEVPATDTAAVRRVQIRGRVASSIRRGIGTS